MQARAQHTLGAAQQAGRSAPLCRTVVVCPVDPETGALLPVVTIVTDNGGPFRSFRFESFIAGHPELHHVRTRNKTPGQNGSRERGFGTLKYERLYLDEIDDAIVLAERGRGLPDAFAVVP